LSKRSAVAGKTTLLKVLAGQLKVPEDKVTVIGSAPFYDLVSNLFELNAMVMCIILQM
jgi:ABC-type uncharacterized transport system ATPase subunit